MIHGELRTPTPRNDRLDRVGGPGCRQEHRGAPVLAPKKAIRSASVCSFCSIHPLAPMRRSANAAPQNRDDVAPARSRPPRTGGGGSTAGPLPPRRSGGRGAAWRVRGSEGSSPRSGCGDCGDCCRWRERTARPRVVVPGGPAFPPEGHLPPSPIPGTPGSPCASHSFESSRQRGPSPQSRHPTPHRVTKRRAGQATGYPLRSAGATSAALRALCEGPPEDMGGGELRPGARRWHANEARPARVRLTPLLKQVTPHIHTARHRVALFQGAGEANSYGRTETTIGGLFQRVIPTRGPIGEDVFQRSTTI